MSAQFGNWNLNGRARGQRIPRQSRESVGVYGPDGHEQYSVGDICFQSHSFRTTKESHGEEHPVCQPIGLSVYVGWPIGQPR